MSVTFHWRWEDPSWNSTSFLRSKEETIELDDTLTEDTLWSKFHRLDENVKWDSRKQSKLTRVTGTSVRGDEFYPTSQAIQNLDKERLWRWCQFGKKKRRSERELCVKKTVRDEKLRLCKEN